MLLIAKSFMREGFESVRSTEKRDRHPQGVPLILLGGYRASGNLPVRRYTKRLVQTSKSDKSNDPNGKQVGESAARGRVRTERSPNIYDSHTTPRYAGYAQGAYANSGALETISKRTFKKCVLYLKENLQLYVRGARVRAEHEKRDRHPQGVPLILSGGYRASGNLPVRRYTKRLVQTSKSDESNNPNGKQVGESAARGRYVKSVP